MTIAGKEIYPPVDSIFNSIGDFGKWQLRISLLMAFLKLPIAWFQLGNILIAPKTDFNCIKPNYIQNVSNTEWRSLYSENLTNHLDACSTLNESILKLLDVNGSYVMSPLTQTRCELGFEYDRSQFSSSIITEWNLVCDREWMANFSQMVLMIGVLIGNIIFGIAADRQGRKSALILAIAGQSICGIIMSIAPGYWTFTLARFLVGVANGGTMIISFVLCMEVVSSKYRPVVPILYQIPFGLGSSLMALLGYWIRDWRELQLALSSLSLIFLLNYWFCTESPRWLLATNRKREGCELLAKICVINGLPVDNIKFAGCHLLQNENAKVPVITKDDGRPANFTVIFKIPSLLKRTLIIYVNWFINGATFFAFSLHLGAVGTNPWLTLGTSGLAVVPGAFLCMFCVQKFGRKLSLIYANLVISFCLIMMQGIPLEWDWLKLPLISLSVIALSVSMPALYLYTGELYPTVIRNAGVGSAAMFSRIGSLLSPILLASGTSEVGGFVSVSWSKGPPVLLVLSIFMVVQAILIIPLPETKDKPLPDTIEQAYPENRTADAELQVY